MFRSSRSTCRPLAGAMLEVLESRRLLASIAVVNNNDSGAGSLRAAVLNANANDTIDLTGRTGTIVLANPLVVSRALNVVGPGADVLTISGGDATAGFCTYNGSRLAVSGVTLAHFTVGSGGWGGAVISTFLGGASFQFDHVNFTNNRVTGSNYAPAITMEQAGTLSMVDCNVIDNTGAGRGGGVYAYGSQFSAVRCTFARNSALYGGAGLKLIFDTADVLTNCTIADNTVDGGSHFFANGSGMECASAGTVTMTNCTVVRNNSINVGNSISGGGVYIQLPSAGPGRSVTLTNTIVAGNTNGARGDLSISNVTDPSIFNAGHCLIGDGDASGLTDGVNGNLVGTRTAPIDARVGPLGNHGGATATGKLLTGSLAIDAGVSMTDSPAVPPADQRGVARRGNTDIGAYEDRPRAPVFLDGPLRSAAAGSYYVVVVHTEDIDGDPITISATGLPAWLNLSDRHDGTATLIGQPAASDAGMLTFDVLASDGQLATTQTWTVDVSTTEPEFFPATTLPTATAGQPYSTVVTAVVGGSHGYSLVGRSLPAWLTLTDQGNGTAVIEGFVPLNAADSTSIGVFVSNGRYGSTEGYLIRINPYPATLNRHGVLAINGTEADDDVLVLRRGDTMRVSKDGRLFNFDASAVRTVLFTGLGGNDRLMTNVGNTPVYVNAGAGDDTLLGSDGNDTLQGDGGDDVIDGGVGRDSLYGDIGNDSMTGGTDADTLFGGVGEDTLDGGAGRDLLRGEGGRDLFHAADGYGDRVTGGLPGEGDQGFFDRKDRYLEIENLIA